MAFSDFIIAVEEFHNFDSSDRVSVQKGRNAIRFAFFAHPFYSIWYWSPFIEILQPRKKILLFHLFLLIVTKMLQKISEFSTF